jgi:hypothetical protein
MPNTWEHISKGIFLWIPVTALSAYTAVEAGLSPSQLFWVFIFMGIPYAQGLVFPDLDMESSLPFQNRGIYLLPQSIALGLSSLKLLEIEIVFVKYLQWVTAVLVAWFSLIVLFHIYIEGMSHRGFNHEVMASLVAGVLNAGIASLFSLTVLGVDVRFSVIFAVYSGLGFLLGSLVHLFLDGEIL